MGEKILEIEKMGNLINYLRKKKNIKVQKLCRGVCSNSAFARLEQGERIPDFFVLERIMERLGKSINKIELVHDGQTYEIYYLREILEKYLEEKKYEEVVNGIKYYEEMKIAEQPLHKQYINKIKAVLEEEYYKNNKESIKYLEQAIELTLPDFDIENIKEFVFGEEEFILILMWLKQNSIAGKLDILKYNRIILEYVQYNFSDEEIFANIYGKAAWIFMKEFLKQGKRENAEDIGVNIIEILVNNGLLLNLPQFLELLLSCYKNSNEEKYIEWKRKRDALKWVYESYGKIYKEEINIWKKYCQRELYLMSEIIGQERKLLKKSQEKIANELEIDQKTISRIETGKYSPKSGTFEKLKSYMEIGRDICSTHLVVDKFETLELEREISREMYFRRYENAEYLYTKLKKELSLEYNENKQYIMYTDVIFDVYNSRISREKAIETCIEAFLIMRKNISIDDLSKIVLSRNEVTIITYIARMYSELGKKEQSIHILEQILKGFESSRVDLKYHYVSISLLYEYLSGKYEESNQFDKALEFCKKGIKFELECERGNSLGYYIMQSTYIRERMTGKKEACKYYYQQAYLILQLMKVDSTTEALKKYYKKNYNEDIFRIL